MNETSPHDWRQLVAELNALLKLKTTVIGMKLYERVEDMEAIARIRRLKLAVTPIALLDDRALPPLFDEILVPGRAQLEALGFRYVASTREDSPVRGARLSYFTELFLHPEAGAYARLTHLVYPSIAWPYSLSFATWTAFGCITTATRHAAWSNSWNRRVPARNSLRHVRPSDSPTLRSAWGGLCGRRRRFPGRRLRRSGHLRPC